jgi:hypothetical protein
MAVGRLCDCPGHNAIRRSKATIFINETHRSRQFHRSHIIKEETLR